MDAEQIRTALTALRQHDLPTHGGRTLAYVYDSGLAEVDAVGREALAAYGSTNALDPTAFPSLLQMEQDLIADAAALLDGPPGTVGTVTSGGTESILLAVQTARDAHPDITGRRWCCPRPHTGRSTRRRTTSGYARSWSTSTRGPAGRCPRP
jgi:glutamate/tyrosine decarboxylase-like PLP-dependent enzyme